MISEKKFNGKKFRMITLANSLNRWLQLLPTGLTGGFNCFLDKYTENPKFGDNNVY